MKTRSLLVLAFVLPFSLFGAKASSRPPFGINFSAFQMSIGNQYLMSYPWTLEEFLPLAGGSALLKNQSFDDYDYSGGFGPYPGRSNAPSVSASFVATPGSHEDGRGAILRTGLRFQAGNSRSLEVTRRVSGIPDTLYSIQGGYFGTIETYEFDNYRLTYGSNRLLLDLSVLYSTGSRYRIRFYGGAGVAAGFSLSSRATIEHRNGKYNILKTRRDETHYSHYLYVNEELHREEINAPRNTGGSLFLPAGLSLYPGKKGGARERVHLFFEIQPGIHLTRIKGHSSYFSSGIEQRVGIQLSW
jgi:hypothetical protein